MAREPNSHARELAKLEARIDEVDTNYGFSSGATFSDTGVETITISSQGAYVAITASLGFLITENWTYSSGVWTYTGPDNVRYRVTATVTIEPVAGATTQIFVVPFVDGNGVAPFGNMVKSSVLTSGTTVMDFVSEIPAGSEFDMRVANAVGTDNLTLYQISWTFQPV